MPVSSTKITVSLLDKAHGLSSPISQERHGLQVSLGRLIDPQLDTGGSDNEKGFPHLKKIPPGYDLA